MGPLICEAARQAANACCYRRTKSSVRRIGAEFRSWFGAYLCGITTNHTNAVPVLGSQAVPRASCRIAAIRLYPRIHPPAQIVDPGLARFVCPKAKYGRMWAVLLFNSTNHGVLTVNGRPLEGASSGQPIDNTSNQRTSDL